MTDAHQRTNRLSAESSPYLRQHQHNPVDWYAWGPEAFEAARTLHRPIFLSVGYSTCYWCHVMERQCFESPAIAAEMNQRFISIKVDREERPDVDQLYMTAVQLLTRQGGWPMSVFLTPDLRPFYGGTYFPPTDQYGRPGFPTLLRALDNAWQTRPADIDSTGDQLVGVLRRLAEPVLPDRAMSIDGEFTVRLIDRSISDYDPKHGGFGGAPKFPRQTLLELLLAYSAPERESSPRADKVRAIVLHTLDALDRGGIHDHLGGGFHRYSTDAQWLVPHFEIMLYDNAMLAWCYVEAFRQTRDPRWANVARGIFDFVLREMTSPDGAFYTAFDAEVDAMEGASYLWTRDEVLEILRQGVPSAAVGIDHAELFCRVYGLDDGPNFADPHHGNGTPDKNILFLPRTLEEAAAKSKIAPGVLPEHLARSRDKLLAARAARKQPLLDTKILTSWNALMIRAFAHGGQVLERPNYLIAAERAANFLLERHASPDGGLLRTSGGVATVAPATRPPISGFLDDYAFLAQALLALASCPLSRYSGVGLGRGPKETGAHFEPNQPPSQPSPVRLSSPKSGVPEEGENWSSVASRIIDQMIARFGDRDSHRGFFFTDASGKELIVRQKTGTDSPISSGNGVAAMILLETGRTEAARGTLTAFAESMNGQGEAMSAMIKAALAYVDTSGPIAVEPTRNADANRPASPRQIAEDLVQIEVSQRGESALDIELTIQPGWHLNAHNVASSVPLVATSVTVAPEPASIKYPLGEQRKFDFADEPLLVYGGRVVIGVQFARKLDPEKLPQLTLTYQACDDSTCLPPVTKRIVLNG